MWYITTRPHPDLNGGTKTWGYGIINNCVANVLRRCNVYPFASLDAGVVNIRLPTLALIPGPIQLICVSNRGLWSTHFYTLQYQCSRDPCDLVSIFDRQSFFKVTEATARLPRYQQTKKKNRTTGHRFVALKSTSIKSPILSKPPDFHSIVCNASHIYLWSRFDK